MMILRSLLVLSLFCFRSFSAETVETVVFNTGQANASITKIGDCALVTDFGFSGLDKSHTAEVLNAATNFLKHCRKVALLVTHQHFDHYSHVEALRQKLAHYLRETTSALDFQFAVVLIGGQYTSRTPEELKIPGAYFCEVAADSTLEQLCFNPTSLTYECIPSDTHLTKNLLDSIFATGSVELLLPPRRVGGGDHDQNLLVKVNYLDKAILLTGDASAELIKKTLARPPITTSTPFPPQGSPSAPQISPLSNVSVVVPSHHFSNASDEVNVLWNAMITRNPEREPFLTIIPSDPRGKNHIPTTESIKRLAFPIEALGKYFCVPHTVHASYTIATPRVIDVFPYDVDAKVLLPVFCTSNAKVGYRVTIFPSISGSGAGGATSSFSPSQHGVVRMVEITSPSDLLYQFPGAPSRYADHPLVTEFMSNYSRIIPTLPPSRSGIRSPWITAFKAVNSQEMDELEKERLSKVDQITKHAAYFDKLFTGKLK